MNAQISNDAIESYANGTAFVAEVSANQERTGKLMPIKELLAEQIPAHQHADVLALLQEKLSHSQVQAPETDKPIER